jgi:hypothetical protein
MRRIWPIGAIIIGARLLLSGFIITTATGESLLDRLSTPIGIVMILGGGYFLLKDYE